MKLVKCLLAGIAAIVVFASTSAFADHTYAHKSFFDKRPADQGFGKQDDDDDDNFGMRDDDDDDNFGMRDDDDDDDHSGMRDDDDDDDHFAKRGDDDDDDDDDDMGKKLLCETAFGIHKNCVYDPYDPKCMSIPLNKFFKSARWGWVTKVPLHTKKELHLFAGAGQNDLDKGTKVGKGWIKYFKEKQFGGCWVKVEISTDMNWKLKNSHVFIGSKDELLKLKTPAPGRFPFRGDGGKSDVFKVKLKHCPKKAFVITHADVCKIKRHF